MDAAAGKLRPRGEERAVETVPTRARLTGPAVR